MMMMVTNDGTFKEIKGYKHLYRTLMLMMMIVTMITTMMMMMVFKWMMMMIVTMMMNDGMPKGVERRYKIAHEQLHRTLNSAKENKINDNDYDDEDGDGYYIAGDGDDYE